MTNINTEEKSTLVDWAEEAVQIGTPTMVLLSPRNYQFKVLKNKHKITIQRNGTYHDIAPDFFAEEDGAFNLLDEKNMVMYLPAITKVLFAEKKYPMMSTNQMFAPLALVFHEDTVDILGQIIEMIIPEKDYSVKDDATIKSV